MTKGGYQFFATLPTPQYESLKTSIREHGVLVPIIVDEEGHVLDGHHRRRAAAELHVDCPSIVKEGLSEEEKEAFVITTNALRRQLSTEERAKAISRLKVLGWSTRRISSEMGVHHSTVERAAGARERAPETPARVPEASHTAPVEPAEEGTGDRKPQPAPTPRVTGKDGKSYPARKPPIERTESDDFYDRFRKEMERTYKTLLEMNPAHIAEVTLPIHHQSLVNFARSLSEWAVDLQTAVSTKPDLKVAK